ncbi:29400_t:CDS:1, partial [Racocetra persica]
ENQVIPCSDAPPFATADITVTPGEERFDINGTVTTNFNIAEGDEFTAEYFYGNSSEGFIDHICERLKNCPTREYHIADFNDRKDRTVLYIQVKIFFNITIKACGQINPPFA